MLPPLPGLVPTSQGKTEKMAKIKSDRKNTGNLEMLSKDKIFLAKIQGNHRKFPDSKIKDTAFFAIKFHNFFLRTEVST